MKIVFYIDCMQMGGANRVIANLVNHYAEEGCAVLLITDTLPEKGKNEYPIDLRVKRIIIDQEIKKPKSRIKWTLTRLAIIRSLLKDNNADLIVSFMGPPNIRMLLSTIGLRIKKVISVRNDPYREYGKGLIRLITRQIFKLADGLVFQTKQAADYFGKRLTKRGCIILNPVKESFFECSYNEEAKDIVVIGRLQPQKNPLLAVNAFAKVANLFMDTRLLFYGDGELANDIIEILAEKQLRDRVELCGQTNSVESVLENACVYLLTSDYEGMPNALMEAMAVGVPSISTDCPCGGPRELIKNDSQGCLVPVNDVENLAKKIECLLRDKEKRIQISRNAKKRAREFMPKVIFSQWDLYFEKVLKR